MKASKKTAKANLPKTVNDMLREAETESSELRAFIRTLERDVAEHLHDRFVAAGGCKTCRGRGWIVTWDTMDIMDGSCAEFGSCPDAACTEESRTASGLDWDPAIVGLGHTKYDRLRNVPYLHAEPAWHAIGRVAQPIFERVVRLGLEINGHKARAAPRIGDEVVIVKGRKAPIGFTGKIFWHKKSQWGVRIGVKDQLGAIQWTYLKNVEKLA